MKLSTVKTFTDLQASVLSGGAAELTPAAFTIFAVIIAHDSPPSIADVCLLTGIHRNTVSKTIKTLVEQGYIKKLPTSRAVPTATDGDSMNSSQFIKLFCTMYEQTYDSKYIPNWRTESAIVKSKLLKNFTLAQLITMLETLFTEYEHRWKTNKYPRPTVGMLCSWLVNDVMTAAAARPVIQSTDKVDWAFLDNDTI